MNKKPYLTKDEINRIEAWCKANKINNEHILGNTLIAKFMGAEILYPTSNNHHIIVEFDWNSNYQPINIISSESNDTNFVDSAIRSLYNRSWDWLMPVIHKIATIYQSTPSIDLVVSMRHDNFSIIIYEIPSQKTINKFKYLYDTFGDIDQIYKCVIEFIKWYNENNKEL